MKKDKIIFGIIVLLFFVGLTSCEEEQKGPLTDDGTVPSSVTAASVENLPGGAKIQYTVPSDEDVLLVEANFERNGDLVTTKSSVFKDFVTIEGLNSVEPLEVSLVVVDRSDNRSAPVVVTINPEESPLKRLFKTFDLVDDFGGPRLWYENKDDIQVEFLLYTIENGTKTYKQSAFINNGAKNFEIFRGFPPKLTKFGVEAIDRWDNMTPLFEKDIEPFEEVLLDRLSMRGEVLTGDETSRFGWVLQNLFNGVATGGGFHTDQTSLGVVIPPYTEPHHMFTMDMGVVAKLSRLKFWPRQGDCCGTPFAHGDPKFFEIWGIDEIPADDGASLDGWTKLVENGEVVKPSGAPLGSNSAEDIAFGASGVEFNVPVEAQPVRFIRFVNFENWSGTSFLHIMEFEFFGQPQ